MPLRVLIDLNVLLDALKKREPFFQQAAAVLALAEIGEIEGYMAGHSATTLYYLIARDISPAAARFHLMRLAQFIDIAAVDGQAIRQALALPFSDFEDAVQMMAAVQAGAQYIVTRDRSGFKPGPLPSLSPGELLAQVGGGAPQEE